ncbi:MAG: galactokinase [Negativicutes bacterium]|nr:galactokinase [Negativicutes bacterium]
MIIVRSPLRISLGGGGTDLPSYYRKHGGFLLAAAIDKYVYITLHRSFSDDLIIKYSQYERVREIAEIRHPIIREAARLTGLDIRFLEITSMADIPAGTGLGSSGSFTTALLKAIYTWQRRTMTAEQLAADACEIEIDRLGEPVGRQDQYIAAIGGLTCFRFSGEDKVEHWPLAVDGRTIHDLEDSLLLVFTGFTRPAARVLAEQDAKSRQDDREMTENLHFVKQLGQECRQALEAGDVEQFGRLLDVHWQHKKRRSGHMTNPVIDEIYSLAMNNGALGGKLIGAGGGGFLLFCTRDKLRLRRALSGHGLSEVRFGFDFEGTKVVIA